MDISGSDKEIGGKCKCGSVYSPLWVMICSESETKKAAKRQQRGKGERKKEERIKCKHTSFTPCVCASNENANIFV